MLNGTWMQWYIVWNHMALVVCHIHLPIYIMFIRIPLCAHRKKTLPKRNPDIILFFFQRHCHIMSSKVMLCCAHHARDKNTTSPCKESTNFRVFFSCRSKDNSNNNNNKSPVSRLAYNVEHGHRSFSLFFHFFSYCRLAMCIVRCICVMSDTAMHIT